MRRLDWLLAIIALSACAGAAESSRRDPAVAGQAPRPRASAEASSSEASGGEVAPAGERADAALDDTVAEVRRGRASYYSDSLAGNHTANGDVYDPAQRTAASRDLPFGTRVRVVREDTGASVIVRVNDRGPFRDHARILDLSRAAAEALGMIDAGVVDIRAEILNAR